jgi:hypothetical protein
LLKDKIALVNRRYQSTIVAEKIIEFYKVNSLDQHLQGKKLREEIKFCIVFPEEDDGPFLKRCTYCLLKRYHWLTAVFEVGLLPKKSCIFQGKLSGSTFAREKTPRRN